MFPPILTVTPCHNLMVALPFCADSIAAVFNFLKGSLDPDPALLGTIIAHAMASMRRCNYLRN